jgi:hypothetical protein
MARVRLGRGTQTALFLLFVLLAGGIALFQSVRVQALDDQVKGILGRQGLDDPAHLAGATAEYQSRYRTALGLPYAYDLDSYYYLAEAERGSLNNPLAAVYGLAYRSVRTLISHATPSDAVFFLPLLFGLLTLASFFFLARHVTGNVEAALYAGLVLALHHRFFAGTAAGMADNQSINLLFSVLFFLFFLLAADKWKAGAAKHAAVFGVLALLVFVLFAFTWQGAVHVIAVLIVAAAAHKAVLLAKQRAWLRIGMLVLALAGLAWLFSTTALGRVVRGYLGFIPRSAHAASIAELYGGDAVLFAIVLGGWSVLVIAMVAWIALAGKNAREPSFNWLVVLAWFALLGFATYQAVRFTYYVLPPTALLVGVTVRHLAVQARARFRSRSGHAAVALAALAVIGLLTLPLLVRTQHAMRPLMHNGIIGMGSVIEGRTSPETRIVSWWEYGHLWNYAAKREPYLDGRAKPEAAGARNARLWIVSRAFLSHSPEEAQMLWTVLRCQDRVWINERLGNLTRMGEGACGSPTPAIVVVDERMLDTAQSMADIVVSKDSSFAAGSAEITPVEQCSISGPLLSCGTYSIDLAERRTSDGIPVWLTVNGTRSVTNASDKVAVVYESQENYFAFVTTPWFADTVLVRLLAGESLGIQPLASVDAPERIVAYRLT